MAKREKPTIEPVSGYDANKDMKEGLIVDISERLQYLQVTMTSIDDHLENLVDALRSIRDTLKEGD